MTAAKNDIVIEQGATFFQRYTWEDDLGAGIPLTTHTIRMMVRETHDATSAIVSLTSSPAAGIVITDAPNGKFEVTIDATTTAAITQECGVYNIEIEDSSTSPNTVTRLIEGDVTITPDATY